jgi:molecular chaperone GrpE
MFRYPPNPLAYGGAVVDAQAARAAIERVAAERDALARQVDEAHRVLASLQRRLEAREGENAHLVQALRAAERRGGALSERATHALAEQRDQAVDEAARLRERLRAAERVVRRVEAERDEALAERDAARAASRRAEAELAELREAAPEAGRVQRLAADLANLRRQRDAAIAEGVGRARARVLARVAPLRDAMSAALASGDEASPWHRGVLALRDQLDGLLAAEGARLVGHVGEAFDPAVHEAVGTAPGEPAGRVAAVVGCGVALEDGVLATPARVIVSAGTR